MRTSQYQYQRASVCEPANSAELISDKRAFQRTREPGQKNKVFIAKGNAWRALTLAEIIHLRRRRHKLAPAPAPGATCCLATNYGLAAGPTSGRISPPLRVACGAFVGGCMLFAVGVGAQAYNCTYWRSNKRVANPILVALALGCQSPGAGAARWLLVAGCWCRIDISPFGSHLLVAAATATTTAPAAQSNAERRQRLPGWLLLIVVRSRQRWARPLSSSQ